MGHVSIPVGIFGPRTVPVFLPPMAPSEKLELLHRRRCGLGHDHGVRVCRFGFHALLLLSLLRLHSLNIQTKIKKWGVSKIAVCDRNLTSAEISHRNPMGQGGGSEVRLLVRS
ncbi:hypothetical protein PTKIN_Ptkin01aG0305500 [Pterospermum kingtungense]